jgi:putative PIN family toxin of toxin-antitoxin system
VTAPRVVFDTNVLVSATLRPQGTTAGLLTLAAEGKVMLVLSPAILEETAEVLERLGLEKAQVQEALDALRDLAEIVKPTMTLHIITADPDDDRILECAVAGKVQVLVTGDKQHLRPMGTFQGIEIWTPREFLDRYFP